MSEDFFLPYQKKWIKDSSRIKLMEKSRQIGMSWTTAYELVRNHCLQGMNRDSWVSSRDELQAKLFIDDCKKFADILNVATAEYSQSSLAAGGDSRTLEFANGSRIWSLSSNPDAQAGKRGTRVLDEFALHPDPSRLYSVAYPGITWGGNMQILSTHRGKNNFFFKLVEEIKYGGNPKNISLHTVTLEDALNQGLLKKLKANMSSDNEIMAMDESDYFYYIKNSCADNESFLQEYMCQPSDDNDSFIAFDDLMKCAYNQDFLDWNTLDNESNFLFLGVDVARCQDLSVFWLLEKSADVLYTRDVKIFKDVSFAEQESVLHSFLKMPNLRKVAIDQSGLGRQFAERAATRYGSSRIEGVSFSQATKELLAYPLKTRFQEASIRIPNDLEVFSDIRGVKKTSTINGSIKFTAERSVDGHSDRFWALALAVYAANGFSGSGKMQLIENKRDMFIW